MPTIKSFVALVTNALLLAGNGITLATPTPNSDVPAKPDGASRAITPAGDIVATQALEDGWTINWYGNATQEALIADTIANNKSLAALDFLADDPSLSASNDKKNLAKRQCPSSGIECTSYWDESLTAPYRACQHLLGYIDAHKFDTLPAFPHSVCVIGINWWDQCCASWPHSVLGYLGDLQLPLFLTYNQCELPAMAGRNKGVILGGVCQNVCMAWSDSPWWCNI